MECPRLVTAAEATLCDAPQFTVVWFVIDEAELSNSKLMPCGWLGMVLMPLLRTEDYGTELEMAKMLRWTESQKCDNQTTRWRGIVILWSRRAGGGVGKGEDDGTSWKDRNSINCLILVEEKSSCTVAIDVWGTHGTLRVHQWGCNRGYNWTKNKCRKFLSGRDQTCSK